MFGATSWTEVGKSDSSAAPLKTQLLNTLTALPVNIIITATPRNVFFFLIRETFYPEPLSNKIVMNSSFNLKCPNKTFCHFCIRLLLLIFVHKNRSKNLVFHFHLGQKSVADQLIFLQVGRTFLVVLRNPQFLQTAFTFSHLEE